MGGVRCFIIVLPGFGQLSPSQVEGDDLPVYIIFFIMESKKKINSLPGTSQVPMGGQRDGRRLIPSVRCC